ncbi:MAG: hypothetical protein ABEH56_02755 [Salinirussus sp.]
MGDVTTRDGDCTTTRSFADHGIDDGSDLIQRTYYRLAGPETPGFEPTEAFFGRLESAFLWAYMGSAAENDVPPHVRAAIDDARVLTAEEFDGRPDADLRTDVLPAFYRRVAGFHCAYR